MTNGSLQPKFCNCQNRSAWGIENNNDASTYKGFYKKFILIQLCWNVPKIENALSFAQLSLRRNSIIHGIPIKFYPMKW